MIPAFSTFCSVFSFFLLVYYVKVMSDHCSLAWGILYMYPPYRSFTTLFSHSAMFFTGRILRLLLCLFLLKVELFITNISQVERWWNVLLPKVFPLLYSNGGPVIMVQVCTWIFFFTSIWFNLIYSSEYMYTLYDVLASIKLEHYVKLEAGSFMFGKFTKSRLFLADWKWIWIIWKWQSVSS